MGKTSVEFYTELMGKVVVVGLPTSSALKGELIGVDVYNLIIRRGDGLEVLIPKGSLLYLHKSKG